MNLIYPDQRTFDAWGVLAFIEPSERSTYLNAMSVTVPTVLQFLSGLCEKGDIEAFQRYRSIQKAHPDESQRFHGSNAPSAA